MKNHIEDIQAIWTQAQTIADFAAYCGFMHRRAGMKAQKDDYKLMLRYANKLVRMIRTATG